ncbi:conserved Plasmodium protein, unknown function [Plasmodium knowlesi strain H]|uniref:Uncharacterized protein n=3 Tax=Plasmodium knowlesi TaxID=5850 RepID=A0A5K1TX20_PLAKH|nr:conserved Plasmodium protein, unknown function [Plasmodium knowlesi strain H]OTN66596.1 Uncharacterized protein PKNOH_S08484800 [Plasmodium knowlesi]CAA9986879.1 conserved Plasmodium protein, unknown function [Plasmodium knowlesi strain H]SBO23730.1 conserved Plasmodium protein, unknown function [Plasmodium knowlesi strain H]SBO25407.1 conserved Plasmodium protein, unknown function [Plasmodium knowlesi strain H]VVS76353.1 conserved Plasmodium protein, unknown function [Plasmodium knowlesi s|eukprot:XP_002260638.1 hypothetical protein, conserved in Plasmodium species [Plasmodium knowlesi strain H]
MNGESRQVNAPLRKCTEMEYMCHLYNTQLIEQRERINEIKKKLNSYNQTIQEQENLFNHFTKYTDGFLNNIITFLGNFTNSKKFGMFGTCARYCLVDDRNEINFGKARKAKGVKKVSNIGNIHHSYGGNDHNRRSNCSCNCSCTCCCKKFKSKKCVSNQCQNTIVYNKTSFYVEENTNRKKSKKKGKHKNGLKKKYLQLTKNIYNLNNPYDTVEVRDLYDIYRKQSSSHCHHYYVN